MTRSWPFIRLIPRRAQVHMLPRNASSHSAHLEDGAATDLGFTRDRQSMSASRASPTCVFETPRTRPRNLGRLKIAAPHHEAGWDRDCINSSESYTTCSGGQPYFLAGWSDESVLNLAIKAASQAPSREGGSCQRPEIIQHARLPQRAGYRAARFSARPQSASALSAPQVFVRP